VSAPVVEFTGVSKSYSIYSTPGDRLKELATFHRRQFHQDYWALRDVTFDVGRGETFCIVGENGCGKSTLLQICAGILQPTAGTVNVHGRIAALLELGTGFNPEFSGRDNVYLNAAILGFSAKQIDRKFADISEFAEIGEFIDQPVKTYSSGMVVRLAFAVAINVDPEVLLVDEALAVGDIYFRQRCLRKVHELRSRGVTILFVSHAIAEVKALGDRALWLEKGRVMAQGTTERVTSQYLAAMAEKDAKYQAMDVMHHPHKASDAPLEIIDDIPNIDYRYGDGRAEILGIAVCDDSGRPLSVLLPDSAIVVRISVRAKSNLDRPIVGVTFRDERGVDLAGSNTESEGYPLSPLMAGDVATVDFHLNIPTLYSTSLSFSPAVANGTLERFAVCDWIDNAVVLQMTPPDGPMYGHFRFRCRVEVNSRIGNGLGVEAKPGAAVL
jgi:ABC-type polysaccharide/polyol phosphate transport system ATPase subunit